MVALYDLPCACIREHHADDESDTRDGGESAGAIREFPGDAAAIAAEIPIGSVVAATQQ